MFYKLARRVRGKIRYWRLPAAARAEVRRDRNGLAEHDPGIEAVVREGVAWLGRAQDCSASHDGGVARHFSLVDGWGHSYPETTGYIVPTMLAYAKATGNESCRARAKRMLDWLASIQLPDGSFPGGTIDAQPPTPVVFDTGQVLLGLACAVGEFGDAYRGAMCRAADWLASAQDPDGCWRRYAGTWAMPGEKTYDTHVAWAMFEAARLEARTNYADAALANVRWALMSQAENGWFDRCCLTDSHRPLTHTLGYVFRGLVEAYRFTKDNLLLLACKKLADGLLTALGDDGFLPGRLDRQWRGAVPWACLTGSAQIAICWLMLSEITGDARYRAAGFAANRYVRRTIRVSGDADVCGAVKGSYPVDGEYGTYQYLNWACKFVVDSNMLEQRIRTGLSHAL